MKERWWIKVPHWRGSFRNQQKLAHAGAETLIIEKLIVGEFDLPAAANTDDSSGAWSGTLTGELKTYWYTSPEEHCDGHGTFTIDIDLIIEDAGYMLHFNGTEEFSPMSATVTGSFNHHLAKNAEPKTLDQIRLQVEDTLGDFFDRRIPMLDTPGVVYSVVQVPDILAGDNHREHWILIPEGVGGLMIPKPTMDGNLYPPFDNPKIKTRPPYLSSVIKGRAANSGSAPNSGGAPSVDPVPPPTPIHPPAAEFEYSAESYRAATDRHSSSAPEAVALNAYLIESDEVEAQVVHFAKDCPALNQAAIEITTIALTEPGLVDRKTTINEFGKPPCGTCRRMMGGRKSSNSFHFNDSNPPLILYDDRIAELNEEDGSVFAVRLSEIAYFTVSGWFSTKALYLSSNEDYIFEYNPAEKQFIEEVKEALIDAGLSEKSSIL